MTLDDMTHSDKLDKIKDWDQLKELFGKIRIYRGEFQDRVAEEFNRLYIEYQLKYHEKPNMLKRPII